MAWADGPLTACELVARHVYWRSPALQARNGRRREQARPAAVTVSRPRLRDHLAQLGVEEYPLVMVHSSVRNLAIAPGDPSAPISNPIAVASQLLADLISVVGACHTLVMPSHPHFPDDPGFLHDKSALVLEYSEAKTPSRVGLLTELFRRRPGVRRSRHPLSSLAALGPLAEELLRDNLNQSRPLPHGVHSSYFRFCKLGGLVISVGVPLIKAMTVLHVAEEVRDGEWPVRDFFYDRHFRVEHDSETQEWTVRERRPEFVRSLALGQARRDLLREGILTETSLEGLRVDIARAADVLDFMTHKNRNSTYPYFLPSLSRVGGSLR